MNQNPVLMQALVRDRVAELRQSAGAGVSNRDGQRRPGVAAAARRGAGWLLVDLGLRLALPRRHPNGPVARGPR